MNLTSMYLLGSVYCQQIHRSQIQRWVLSVISVPDVLDEDCDRETCRERAKSASSNLIHILARSGKNIDFRPEELSPPPCPQLFPPKAVLGKNARPLYLSFCQLYTCLVPYSSIAKHHFIDMECLSLNGPSHANF